MQDRNPCAELFIMYDDEAYKRPIELAKKSDEDPLTMYLIVRESLNMGMGKTAAQCAHASQILQRKQNDFYNEAESYLPDPHERVGDYTHDIPIHLINKINLFDEWALKSFRKVVLKADENEWVKLKNELADSMILVVDAGLTEVAPNTETVIGLWPMYKSQAPKIIKRLQALK